MLKVKKTKRLPSIVISSIVTLTILVILFSSTTSFSASLYVTSSFNNGDFIPKKYARDGQNYSPELVITGIPANTKTLAIICEDVDDSRSTHWLLWNLLVTSSKVVVPENLKHADKLSDGTRQGLNDFGQVGYSGPYPPQGHGVHHYYFRVYALDTILNIDGIVRKADLVKAMNGHILAQGEIVGLYVRK